MIKRTNNTKAKELKKENTYHHSVGNGTTGHLMQREISPRRDLLGENGLLTLLKSVVRRQHAPKFPLGSRA